MLDGYVGADVESGAKTLDWNVGKVVETSWMMGREKGCLRNVLCIVLILLNVNMMATYWMASEVQGITVAKRQEKNVCRMLSHVGAALLDCCPAHLHRPRESSQSRGADVGYYPCDHSKVDMTMTKFLSA